MPTSNNNQANNMSMIATIQSMRSKEGHYRSVFQTNHEMATGLAQQLNGCWEEISDVFVSEDGQSDQEPSALELEFKEFLQQQKERVLEIAKAKVEEEQKISCFIKALSNLQNSNPNVDDLSEDFVYEEMTKLQQSRRGGNNIDANDEIIQISRTLGFAAAARAPRDNDDSDIELMDDENTSDIASMKCPIMGKEFMEQPMRNQVCKHVYSKEGLEHMFSASRYTQAKQKCPIAGCNKMFSAGQCKLDKAFEIRIRREKRRQRQAQEVRHSQAIDMDADDA